MGENKEEGAWKQATGKVKEEWGDLTDDPKTEAEGKIQQGEGKVQHEWGEATEDTDETRDTANR